MTRSTLQDGSESLQTCDFITVLRSWLLNTAAATCTGKTGMMRLQYFKDENQYSLLDLVLNHDFHESIPVAL